jgi:hypothetical protein
MTQEKILERIEKLLRMAEDSSSPNEAAIAASRAKKLMEKHQISRMDIVLEDLRNGKLSQEDYGVGKRLPKHLNFLFSSVAKYHDCEVKYSSRQVVTFYGYEEDVKMCVMSFNFLRSTIDKLADRDYKQYKKQGGEAHALSWKTSYKKGAASAIVVTLREEKAKEKQESCQSGTSLVIAKDRAIKEHFGNFQYGKSSAEASNRESYSRGYEEGKKVRLSQGIESSAKKIAG